ncbi:MAG: hypothetical protein RQ736_08155, partial [Thiogranum sp.]|nr:hypothetical protein [Thiogranum sp.]
KKALELLEKNLIIVDDSDIPSVHPTLKDICYSAETRLRAAAVPFEYDRCLDVFGMYWHRVHECPAEIEADRQIVKACGALADALRDSGKSEYYRLLDQGIWQEAVGQEELRRYQEKITNGDWLFVGRPDMMLERYLRAMIKCIEDNVAMIPVYQQWMGDVLPGVRILVIPITRSGFIRSPDLPNAMDPIVSL